MIIADIIGLKVNTIDRNSRRVLKIRLDNAVELNLSGPTWVGEDGQNFSEQKIVGGVVTAAAFSGAAPNRIVTITFTDRFGKAGVQVIASDSVTDVKHEKVLT